jgi:hypothetical protein
LFRRLSLGLGPLGKSGKTIAQHSLRRRSLRDLSERSRLESPIDYLLASATDASAACKANESLALDRIDLQGDVARN